MTSNLKKSGLVLVALLSVSSLSMNAASAATATKKTVTTAPDGSVITQAVTESDSADVQPVLPVPNTSTVPVGQPKTNTSSATNPDGSTTTTTTVQQEVFVPAIGRNAVTTKTFETTTYTEDNDENNYTPTKFRRGYSTGVDEKGNSDERYENMKHDNSVD